MSAILDCEKISFSFGERKLFSQLSFSIRPREFWIISGESGVGKSTLLKVLTGEIKSSSGKVRRPQRCSEVPQGLALCSGQTALDTIATGSLGELHWWESFFSLPQKNLQQAHKLAQTFKIDHTLSQNIENISGGEKQRVAMARALMHPSSLFIVDEPISMLDENRAWDALSIMKDEVFANGGSLICVLHQSQMIQKFATHQIILDAKLPSGWKIL